MRETECDLTPALSHGPRLERDACAPKTLLACLEAKVQRYSDGQLVDYDIDGNHRVESFQSLWRRSASIASALRYAGVERSRPVVLIADDILNFVPLAWACIRAGFAFMPLNGVATAALSEKRSDQLFEILERLDRPFVILDDRFESLTAVIRQKSEAAVIQFGSLKAPPGDWTDNVVADPVCLIPTSGSTGRLKLAALGENALLHRNFSKWEPSPREAASVLSLFPVDGVTGMGVIFLHHRNWIQISPDLFTRHPLAALDGIEHFRVERAILTNSMAALIVAQADLSQRRWDLRSLRYAHVGGEPTVTDVMQSLSRLLARHGARENIILVGYGMTETGPLVEGGDPTMPENGQVVGLGGCAPGVDLRIVDENERILNEGELGEVQVFCPRKIFSGYWNDTQATADGFTADGWFRTRDLGRLLHGRLTLHGRSKEIFVSLGKKHSLVDIDAALQSVFGSSVRVFSCAVHLPNDAMERLAVVFVTLNRFYDVALVAEEIRRVVARKFGLQARLAIPTQIEKIPLTSAGKVRRFELAHRVRSGFFDIDDRPSSPAGAPSTQNIQAIIEQIWEDVLGDDACLNPDANFFDLGGDSLKSVLLFELALERLGRSVDIETFFKTPNLANLRRLAEGASFESKTSSDAETSSIRWPLPTNLRKRLLGYFEAWDGDRATQDRLITGLNTGGSKPPLFWCFQDNREFRRLADRLGSDQPLYALRSGHRLISYFEDEIQTLALRYVHEILEVCTKGPLFIGGNCQGGVIAHAVAQHLLRRRRHVPLLVLMEWGFALQPYSGPLLMLYGRESRQANPYLRFKNPETSWSRAFPHYMAAEIPGAHGEFFDDGNIEGLSQILSQCLASAIEEPITLLPGLSDELVLKADELPAQMPVGESRLVKVVVENKTAFSIADSQSGVFVGNYWLNENGEALERADGRARLPILPPGARQNVLLPITAPGMAGNFLLVVDLVEEGSHWLNFFRGSAPRFRVEVV